MALGTSYTIREASARLAVWTAQLPQSGPITFSQTPVRYDRPPPALDEHGAEIRAWLEETP